jgi:hypothetical protein
MTVGDGKGVLVERGSCMMVDASLDLHHEHQEIHSTIT